MNSDKGLRRAAGLLISLALLICAIVPALADEANPSQETEQTEKHEQGKPAKPQQDNEEPTEPAPTERIEANAPDESDDQEHDPAPHEEKPHKFAVNWTSEAFDGQTLNYSGELIVGVGADIAIDPKHDIELTRDGKPTGAPSAGEISLSSSNERYMRVSESGDLYAARKGAAQLQVTVDLPDGSQKQLRKNVKIVDDPTIRFAPDSAFLMNGDDLDLGQFAKAPLLKASPNVNARVRYRLEPVRVGNDSRVDLDEHSGKLSVSYAQPGDIYRITAETYSGIQADFTLYLGSRADRIELSPEVGALDADGRLPLASGDSLALQAVAYSGDAPAAFQGVRWSMEAGADIASIDENGVLRIAAGLDKRREIALSATSEDGTTMSLRVLAMPQ